MKKFWVNEDKKYINPDLRLKVEAILDMLEVAEFVQDMNFPGSQLHLLQGSLRGHYAVHVNGNYVITFRIEDGDVFAVNLLDYH